MIDAMKIGRRLMAAGAVLLVAACATVPNNELRLADRAMIGDLLNRADRGLDVADVAMFTASFTDDAELQFNDNHYNGRAEIQALVEGRAANRRARDAGQGDPNTQLYRVMTNSIIEFTGPDTANHSAYVVVVGHTTPETHMSASGTYDDRLVKRDGTWLIENRVMDTLPRYVPPAAQSDGN
jgi:hypothetical protein